MFGSLVDVYVKMEGVWDVAYGSRKKHSSVTLAKRYCTRSADCFGVMGIGYRMGIAGETDSITFPIQLKRKEFYVGHSYTTIHKKEKISGNLNLL